MQTTSAAPETNSLLTSVWGGYNFSDTTLINKPDIAEQALVNFLAALEAIPEADRAPVIKSMLDSASKNEKVYRYFVKTYNRYLYDPNSPMRNDVYYQPVLEHAMASSQLSEAEKTKYKTLLQLVSKNMPGQPISDFTFIDQTGVQQHFHALSDSTQKLLIFYDPNCSLCAENITAMKNATEINTLIDRNQLDVVAVCAIGDKSEWQAHQPAIPANWLDGFDASGNLIRQSLFDLKAFPTLYWVDRQHNVVLKDATMQRVLGYARTQH